MKSRADSFLSHARVDAQSRVAIELDELSVTREPKFLAENLVIFPEVGKGPSYLFVFARPNAALVEQIVQDLNRRLSEPVLQEQSHGGLRESGWLANASRAPPRVSA